MALNVVGENIIDFPTGKEGRIYIFNHMHPDIMEPTKSCIFGSIRNAIKNCSKNKVSINIRTKKEHRTYQN